MPAPIPLRARVRANPINPNPLVLIAFLACIDGSAPLPLLAEEASTQPTLLVQTDTHKINKQLEQPMLTPYRPTSVRHDSYQEFLQTSEKAEDRPGERQDVREQTQERLRQIEKGETERMVPLEAEPRMESPLPTNPQERTRFFLNLFGAIAYIYDEILVQTGRVGQYYDDILDTVIGAPSLLHRALNEPESVTFGGQYRIRYETLNGRWRRNEVGSDQQLAQRTRLYFGIKNVFDPVRAVIELQDSRVFLTDRESFVNDTHVNEIDIQQLHIDLVSSNFLNSGLSTELSLGRLNLDLGRRRWVARNSFRNTTNTFDGISWLIGKGNIWQVRTFALTPVHRLMRSLDEPSMDRRLWGVFVESHHLTWMRADLYYLGHQDRGPYRDFTMLGGRIRKRPAVGEFQYEAESAYQLGNVSTEGRFQHFQHVEGGFTFDEPWTPQVVFQFDYASRGFDPLYGARVFEFAPTGIFGPVVRSNLLSPGLRIVGNPTDKLSLYLQQRALWLADGRSPWAGNGLQDPTGTAGTFLGYTTDIRVGYLIADNLFYQAGFVYFGFGDALRGAPDATGTPRAHYAYTSLEVLF